MSPVHPQARLGVRRKRLMLSCASAAIAAAILLPQRSAAQAIPGAFQGSIGSFTGSVNRATSGNNETITIGSSTATINWNPYDTAIGGGPIDFLPTGNVATFTSTSGITDYTVLNRIVPNDPSRSILLDGSVISTLQGGSTSGGNIWFYSPGGIVVGANAMFDVGGLLLSTADLPNGFTADATGFSGYFDAPNSSSAIQILNGAQINARNSYVALIAPRIEQGGTVNVNGSAAYVAAEELTMSFNQGLFDVSVDLGTDDANGIVHTGSTTGTGNASAADHHGIYMVAVPKNNALTMLLDGGTVGFSDVQNATVENGEIILSAGYGVSHDDSNALVIDGSYLGGARGGPAAGIDIEGGNFSSSLSGFATGLVSASGGGGSLNFDHDVLLQGLSGSTLIANSGETITVGGSASVQADDIRNFSVANSNVVLPLDAQGGTAVIAAEQGGSISIAGDATVTADARGATNGVTGEGGTSTGGTALVEAAGGTLSVGGDTTISASGLGWEFSSGNVDGAASYGGMAALQSSDGGAVNISGGLTMAADGDGSFTMLDPGGVGGTGYGGIATVWADSNGSIVVGGAASVEANGVGGNVGGSGDGTGGEGRGGTTQVGATAGGAIDFQSNVDFASLGIGGNSPTNGGEGDGGDASLFIDGGGISAAGALRLFADGGGGNGLSAGDGYGGSATAMIGGGEGASAGGTLDVAGEFRLQAGGAGGLGLNSSTGAGGTGGDGFGGSAYFYTTNFLQPSATIDVQLGVVAITANGEGGFGGAGLTGGDGGSGFSGSATTELYGGTISAADFQTFSTARGGAGGTGSSGVGGNGGDAHAGTSTVTIATDVTAGTVYSYDRALAGVGGSGSVQGNGGNASGGTAAINVLSGGSLSGSADLSAAAFGGNGGTGGGAQGGSTSLSVEGTLNGPSGTEDSSGTGGQGSSGAGGAALGGSSTLTVSGTGSITVDNANLSSRGIGGIGGTGATGGDGRGGLITINSADAGSSLVAGTMTANANGVGGDGGNGASGGGAGSGYGGAISTSILGAMQGGEWGVTARGIGGNGGAGSSGIGGDGGYGEGGSISFYSGVDSTIDSGPYTAYANGRGGDGGTGTSGQGNGGSAQSGYNEAALNGTATFGTSLTGGINSGFVVTAFAQGGSGANGGSATAGTSTITVNGDLTSGGIVQATAQAVGGNGAASAGGEAQAGSASITVNGSLSGAALFVATNATGGAGAASAGIGHGGTSTFTVNSGSSDVTQGALVQANGTGASDSLGGGVVLQLDPAASVQFAGLTAEANGLGGTIQITGPLTSTGLVQLTAGGDVGFGNVSADTLEVDSQDGAINGGNITVATRVSAEAAGALILGNITTGPAIPLTDFSVGLASATSIDIGNINSSGPVGFATLGDLTTGNISTGDLALMLVGGDITSGSITTAPGGQVYIGNASMFLAAGGPDDFDPALVLAQNPVATGGAVTIGGPVSTANFRAASGDTFTAGAISAGEGIRISTSGDLLLGALDSGGVIELTSAGLASFTGVVSAPTISVTSHDLNLGTSASLGVDGITDSVILRALAGDQPVLLGDSTASAQAAATLGQYQLSQAEADRIHSDSLSIQAASTGATPAQVIIRNLTLNGSGGGGFSSVDIGTAGSVRVIGNLDFINAVASDALTITGGQRLEVITPDGSIRMIGANDLLAGVLTLQSANIVVTDSSLAQQLAENSNFAGRDAALATNNGAVNPAGYIQAGGISLLSSGNIFIQNTGTATEFAGLTVGGQGLLVGRYSAVTNSDGTQTFSFTGTLTTADDVLYFEFTITAESEITLRTYSYAGGTNGAGQVIPAGGFDPILSLFDAAGHLIGSNDDGGTDVPGDPTTGAHFDTFLQSLLPPGTYTVAITAYSNFPVSDQLSAGFTGGGSFDGRTPNFAFDVSGADTVTGPGDQPLTIIAFGRRQNQDGTFTTGNAFFNTISFADGVEFTDASSFNGCSVVTGCATPPPVEPPPTPQPPQPPASVVASSSILGPVGTGDPTVDPGNSSDDRDSDSSDDDSGDNQNGKDASAHLINTGPLRIEGVIDEPVTSGNDNPGGPQ